MEALKVKKPVWLLSYENVDVSDELGGMVTSVEYVDNLSGTSDELTLTVENADRRWLNGWYPSAADRIVARMGYEGSPLLECGSFRVDQIDMTIGTDTVSIKALAAEIAKPVRTTTHRAFEEVTLRQIAETFARELGLELVGDVASVQIQRVTQSTTTLAFLHKLARSYGYEFSIRGTKLVFFELAKLAAAPPSLTLDITELEPGAQFSGKTANTYAACELTFFDRTQKKNITVRVNEKQARERVVIGGETAEALALPSVTLRQGSAGDAVKKWQTFLASRGIDVGPLDGIFGPKTRTATMAFQKTAGITVDGIAGPETYRAASSTGFGAGTETHAEVAGNVLRIERRVETVEQAELQARAALTSANEVKVTGSATVMGRPELCAGATVTLTGIGRLAGKFMVQKSTHKMDRAGGYKTSIEVSGV